jgi:alpha-mannosidase
VLSALKPAETGQGLIVRVLNPTEATLTAELTFGCELETVVPVRLDETPIGDAITLRNGSCAIDVPPHTLCSLWIT